MAYAPIAFTAPNYRDNANEWIKAYEPGTTTPKVMALESNGGTQVAKLQLNADGFIVSAGAALVIPYLSGAYDLWLFPTEAEADANNTTNAIRLADNILGVLSDDQIDTLLINDLSQAYEFATVSEYKAFTTAFPVGKVINILERNASFTIISGTGTANTWDIISSDTVSQSIVFIKDGAVTPTNLGLDVSASFVDITAGMLHLQVNYKNIHWVAGTYNVDDIYIYENTDIKTDGKNTIIKQNSRPLVSDNRCIRFAGSNVILGGVSCVGNISTDIGEQNHFIYINITGAGQVIENIEIGDCYFQDIRGETIYIQGTYGAAVKNVNIGFVRGDNIYRQGVNSNGNVSGHIKGIELTRVSLNNFNCEPEPYSSKVTGLTVDYIKGKSVALLSTDPLLPCDGINLGYVELDGTAALSDPAYGGNTATVAEHGFVLRNCKYVKVGTLKVNNYTGFGIQTTFNSGELGCEHLRIDDLQIDNCSQTDVANNAFINTGPIGFLDIGRLTANVQQQGGTGKRLFFFGDNVAVDSGDVALGTSCVYMYAASESISNNVDITGTGTVFNSCAGKMKYNGGTILSNRLCSFTHKVFFQNTTVTASEFLFNSGFEDHIAINSTLNGEYYAIGTTTISTSNWTMPYRNGTSRDWYDSSGVKRTKINSDPTSDTDGTVIGTQV